MKSIVFLNNNDEIALERLLIQGVKSFIEQCSLSLKDNISDRYSKHRNSFLYIFKFLIEKWSDTNRSVRLIKKTALEVLFLLLVSKKQIKNQEEIIEKTIDMIEASWNIKQYDFPFLDDKEEHALISFQNSDEIDSTFDGFDFLEKISANLFLKTDPLFVNKLRKQFEFFSINAGRYELEAELQLKKLFACFLDARLFEKYIGSTILLPSNYLLNEITIINESLLKESAIKKRISFNMFNDCYLSKKVFLHNSQTSFTPLPDWALWLFTAGHDFALRTQTKKNIVLGLSLPSKAYAALFFILGYETCNAIQYMQKSNNVREYFDFMINQEKNTPLLMWENGRWKRCYANGMKEEHGQILFSVSVPGTENTRHERFIPQSKIYYIREAIYGERVVGNHQVGHSMRGFDFLKNYYNKNDETILEYLNTNRSRYAVVGNKTLLKNEGDNLSVGMKIMDEGTWITGSLLDILRFEPFLYSEFDMARGTVINSEASIENEAHTDLLVFDGSLPFLNHYDDMPEAALRVVLLDRSEPRFSDACRDLLYRFGERVNDENLFLYDTLPETIEVLMFED